MGKGRRRSRGSSGVDQREAVQVSPVDVDGVRTVAVLTVIWAVGFVVLAFRKDSLDANGQGWWLWTCLAGVGLGLLGLEYTRKRRDAIEFAALQAEAADDESETTPGSAPTAGQSQATADDAGSGFPVVSSPGASQPPTPDRLAGPDPLGPSLATSDSSAAPPGGPPSGSPASAGGLARESSTVVTRPIDTGGFSSVPGAPGRAAADREQYPVGADGGSDGDSLPRATGKHQQPKAAAGSAAPRESLERPEFAEHAEFAEPRESAEGRELATPPRFAERSESSAPREFPERPESTESGEFAEPREFAGRAESTGPREFTERAESTEPWERPVASGRSSHPADRPTLPADMDRQPSAPSPPAGRRRADSPAHAGMPEPEPSDLLGELPARDDRSWSAQDDEPLLETTLGAGRRARDPQLTEEIDEATDGGGDQYRGRRARRSDSA